MKTHAKIKASPSQSPSKTEMPCGSPDSNTPKPDEHGSQQEVLFQQSLERLRNQKIVYHDPKATQKRMEELFPKRKE